MSGHSKWATTKRSKAVVDAKRSANFTKLANLISVAARSGGDVNMNFKLRVAVDKARAASMPKENIERAIKRGTGELEDQKFEQMIYEGFGPDNIAIVMEIITDNKNRTASDVKHLLAKTGGSLTGPNTVMWMFDQKGVITTKNAITEDQQLELIDAGAEEFDVNEDQSTVICPPESFETVKNKLDNLNCPIDEASIEFLPKETVEIKDEQRWQNFLDALENNDDISNYYTNANA